ncbi:ABC transporter ATP-binding protein [Polaromonas sp. P1(28)-8]|nr:ABC transporter ATP-binding protein [Polaromonas sp. P1(28)-8]
MSLVLEQVGFSYPGTSHGVENISINVASGELVAVIGPSGSGKSTLLKLISGLTTGHSGSILLNGADLSHMAVHQRNMGMVFQSYALFPHLNVAENVSYGLKLRNVPKPERLERAKNLLILVGLDGFDSRSVTKLSGGQQQRVALARALAIDPSALLLDEPLSALDASIRGQLRDQIKSIQRRFNATTLLVTHDQEEALTMADRVAVMKDGKLLQFDAPKEIYEAPKSKAVAEFVGLSTIFQAVVADKDLIDIGFCKLHVGTNGRQRGTKLFALMRPEHFDIDPPVDAVNRLAGAVGVQRYLGSMFHYDFQIPDAPKPLLVESRHLAATSIAMPPKHIRLLDN